MDSWKSKRQTGIEVATVKVQDLSRATQQPRMRSLFIHKKENFLQWFRSPATDSVSWELEPTHTVFRRKPERLHSQAGKKGRRFKKSWWGLGIERERIADYEFGDVSSNSAHLSRNIGYMTMLKIHSPRGLVRRNSFLDSTVVLQDLELN